jgi:hypothetical protein
VTQTNHAKHLAMLDRVVTALQKRGIKARHYCPGYVQIDGHDFVYAPGTDQWLLIHTNDHRGPWTRLTDLQDDCSDVEQIANRILAHMSVR